MKDKRFLALFALFLTAAIAVTTFSVITKIRGNDRPLFQLAFALALSAAVYFSGFFYERASGKRGAVKLSLRIILAIYLILFVNFTIFDGHFGRSASERAASMTLAEYFEARGNVIPFKMIYRQTKGLIAGTYALKSYVVNIAGNLGATFPLGILLPLASKKCRRFPIFFAISSLIIVAVETSQLLLRVGSFDVDDYILNIIGAVAGYAILSILPLRALKNS